MQASPDQVLRTLVYYDLFDFPLKKEEIGHCLMRAAADVERYELDACLAILLASQKIDRSGDFYFLKGRDHLVPLRRERQRLAQVRQRRARLVAWLLSWLPTVEGIFISGSLAFNNSHELSDIDVLIVAREGRIWLTRLLVLGLLSVLGIRRTKYDRIAPGKICPNHFISSSDLHIPLHNLYNAQTYINLVALYQRQPDLHARFLEANAWLGEYVESVGQGSQSVSLTTKRFQTPVGAWLERLARRVQRPRIVVQPGVEISDAALAFHPDSQASSIEHVYQEKIKSRV